MQQLKNFILATRSNGKFLPFLMTAIGLNSLFNLLSLVSIFPVVEYVVFGSGENAQGQATGVLGHSRISEFIQSLLDFLGLAPGLAPIAIFIIGIFLAKELLSILTTYSTHSFGERVRCYWIDVVCSRYFYAPFRSVAQESAGVIAGNIIREPTLVARFVKGYLEYLNSLFLSLAIIVGMLYVEWRFVSVFFGCMVLLYPVLKPTLFERSSTYGKKSISLSQAILGLSAEKATHIKQIHILGIEEYSRARIMKVMRDLSQVFIQFQTLKELPRTFVEFFVVAIGLGMLLVVEATYEGGLRSILPSMIFFGVALSRLATMFASLLSAHVACVNQSPSVEILLNLANDKRFDPDTTANDTGLPLARATTDIKLEDLRFSYEENAPVLEGLTCTIPHAQLTCFIGPSGSGKSTLMDLLMRLYEPDCGSIRCNGRDIAQYRLADWRRSIGYISQDASTFSVSLRENITLGRKDISDERLNEVASVLHLDRLVRSLDDGWDTEVGQGGVTLSGGERKRIAIARALLREPDILIFDEATVSFEEGLEREMLAEIRSASPHVSIVVITHRISTIGIADVVHVLERGRIVASGSEAEVRDTAQSLLATPQEKSGGRQEPGPRIDLDLQGR